MLILPDVLTPRNVNFWERQSGDGGRSMNIIVWPADDGPKLVRVRISLTALGDYDGHPPGINSGEIAAAPTRQRELIQQLAQANHRPGDDELTLDVGDFPAR
jgi:hypothetical protein